MQILGVKWHYLQEIISYRQCAIQISNNFYPLINKNTQIVYTIIFIKMTDIRDNLHQNHINKNKEYKKNNKIKARLNNHVPKIMHYTQMIKITNMMK